MRRACITWRSRSRRGREVDAAHAARQSRPRQEDAARPHGCGRCNTAWTTTRDVSSSIRTASGSRAVERATPRNDVDDEHALANRNLLIGAGAALGDIDGDGLPDVFLASVERPAALYHNDGGFRFTDVTATSGIDTKGLATTGAVFADVDGDGDLDLIVGTLGGPLKLWLNDGKGHFTDATAASGLTGRLRRNDAHDGRRRWQRHARPLRRDVQEAQRARRVHAAGAGVRPDREEDRRQVSSRGSVEERIPHRGASRSRRHRAFAARGGRPVLPQRRPRSLHARADLGPALLRTRKGKPLDDGARTISRWRRGSTT